MKKPFRTSFNPENRRTTLIFLIVGILALAAGLIIGLDDNLPGILSFFLGVIAVFLGFIHHWRKARQYLFLFIGSLGGFVLFGVLHNFLEYWHGRTSGIIILNQLLGVFNVVCFLIAVLVCPPGILIGLIGAIIFSIKRSQ